MLRTFSACGQVSDLRSTDAIESHTNLGAVFSRCAGSLEEGRRLENLSWRLWNRETFCCDPVSEANATTPAISICPRISEGHYAADVPELSGSIDSLADEEALEFDSVSSSTSAPLGISRPHITRHDSVHTRSRGLEKHLTSDDLQKMVINIKEKKNLDKLPLELSSHSYLSPPTEKAYKPEQVTEVVPQLPAPIIIESLTSDSASDRSAQIPSSDSSATSALSERSTTSVVRGFSPSHISSSYRSIPLPNVPSSIPSADIEAVRTSTALPPARKKAMFALGGVSSSADSMSDRQNSIESRPPLVQQKKKGIFEFGGCSSNEDENSLPSRYSDHNAMSTVRPAKKQTSFQEEVATRTIREEPFDDDVFETDDEDDIDESAIDDDDDSSDWEDSIEDSGNVSIDENSFFQRVDSRPQLPSRRSLLTVALHQSERNLGMISQAAQGSRSTSALQRSRNTSPNSLSLAPSTESDEAPLTMKRGLKPIPEGTRTGAQPIIMTTTNTTGHQLALSPRTTRRNMLSTELTVSLRQHLLWERQQKSQTANAVLKRRHTAHDVANLKQYPEKLHLGKEPAEASNASWNQYFSQGLGEYHSKGW